MEKERVDEIIQCTTQEILNDLREYMADYTTQLVNDDELFDTCHKTVFYGSKESFVKHFKDYLKIKGRC